MESKNVLDVLAKFFKTDVEQLSDENKLVDIPGWDSLKHMNLIVALETTFGIQFEMEDIMAMDSIGSIQQVVVRMCANGN